MDLSLLFGYGMISSVVLRHIMLMKKFRAVNMVLLNDTWVAFYSHMD